MIAYLISAYTDKEKILRLIKFLNSKNSIFLIHYNKMNMKKYEEIKILADNLQKNNIYIYIIEPINVFWSEFSHVQQKMNAIKYLYDNNIHFDYFISLTENDCPIKSRKFIEKFISKNKNYSFFYDYHFNNTKMYYELEKGFPKNFIDIKRRLRLINNEIPFDKHIVTKKWIYKIHPRNIKTKKEKFFKNFLLMKNSIWIILYVFFPNRKWFLKAQSFYFKKNVDFKDLKIHTEWQYSITSFFSKKFTDFLYVNYEKYCLFFKEIYAPDESIWITIAINNIDKVGDIITNWKPLILSTLGKTNSIDDNELKLSWNVDDISTIEKYKVSNELFCRRVSTDADFFNIIKNIGK